MKKAKKSHIIYAKDTMLLKILIKGELKMKKSKKFSGEVWFLFY